MMGSTQPRRARGSEVSLCGLLQDQLVEREVRDGRAQPRVLGLEFLHPAHPIRLQAPELTAPAIVGDLTHADCADCISSALPLARPAQPPAAAWQRSPRAWVASPSRPSSWPKSHTSGPTTS